jgi:hypothetical protein
VVSDYPLTVVVFSIPQGPGSLTSSLTTLRPAALPANSTIANAWIIYLVLSLCSMNYFLNFHSFLWSLQLDLGHLESGNAVVMKTAVSVFMGSQLQTLLCPQGWQCTCNEAPPRMMLFSWWLSILSSLPCPTSLQASNACITFFNS